MLALLTPVISSSSLSLCPLPRVRQPTQDWNLLKSRAKNLAGRDEVGMRGITKAEVRLHKSQHDCWSIFRGKVSQASVARTRQHKRQDEELPPHLNVHVGLGFLPREIPSS